MSNYPYSQDDNITLPGVSGVTQEEIAISALREATFAIEKELGIVPSGVYSDVRARLDILESRINYGIPSNISSDGYVLSPLILWNDLQSVTLTISDGYGAPTENRINGSLYLRADGYANNDFYIRRDGYWVPIQTEQFTATNDLAGDHLSQTVIGLYNHPFNPAMDTVDDGFQDGYHVTWNEGAGYWESQTGFIAASDLAPDSGYYGRIGQKVIRIQNRSVSPAAPGGTSETNGDSLVWNAATSLWEPQPRAVIFDGYVARTNVRSNRLLQSPIDNTKIGIVNLGNSSVVVGGSGTLANYSAILSGDKNTASAIFDLVVGGESNITSTGAYASVLNGLQNTASGQYSVTLSGNNNTVSGQHSIVLDGYGNTVSGSRSFLGVGGNNTLSANFSTLLGGISNNIITGVNYGLIGGGNSNTIHAPGTYSVILSGSGNDAAARNSLIGPATDGYTSSNYTVIGSGLTPTIGSSSTYSVLLNGNINAISASTQYGLIGTGYDNDVTSNYATVLNGTINSVNGLHSIILNGHDNTVSGPSAYGVIIDGYGNTISGVSSLIADGYDNTITGIYSTILNGNTNTINSNYSLIGGGSDNTINVSSHGSVVLAGINNSLTGSAQSLALGNSNTLSANLILAHGNFNTVTATQVRVFGSNNIINSPWSNVFGSSNNPINGSLGYNHVFGTFNTTGASSGHNLIVGDSNSVDGYHSLAIGKNNSVNSTGYFSMAQGRYAKTRVAGQVSQAASNFNGTTAGEAQFSRVILTGSGDNGIGFLAQVPGDGYLTFENGKAYDLNIRVLIVNNQSPLVDPTKPARFVYDILASQEGGILTLHDVNNTLTNQNGTGWTITIAAASNQLVLAVDPATFPQSPVPFNTSDRRVIATVEWREITRA